MTVGGKAYTLGTPENGKYTIPGTDLTRQVIRIEKIAPTPEKYPRRFAKIQKAPL